MNKNKTIFLYSGEGTRSNDTSNELIRTSPHWNQIAEILDKEFSLSLEELWEQERASHSCPWSPLLTVAAGICLSDIWKSWGYEADIVIGHSVGEITAAYHGGIYSLEQTLRLAHELGNVAATLNGRMFHGLLSDEQIEQCKYSISSFNFIRDGRKHVTVSCSEQETASFRSAYPKFIEMKPQHPWHHRRYQELLGQLPEFAGTKGREIAFVSGVTAQFEETLGDAHWRNWLHRPIDFIAAMSRIADRYPEHRFEIIEIGCHPVLEACCSVFENYRYASSMYRGENEYHWILYQRKQLDPAPFISRIEAVAEQFQAGLEFQTPLAYQGFTSLKFVELAAALQSYFPGLAPQDFYRYKSIDELIARFGLKSPQTSADKLFSQRNKVVIAAMSCRFPASVKSPVQFWQMLESKEDQVRRDMERGDYEAGFLDRESARFDHGFFNIPEAEAKTMDPQQVLALELTELLWRDAGIDPQTIDRKRVGVYLGVWNEEYRGNPESVFYPTGTNPSIIASRISYHYDLRGPSWVANTACSSSLLALHYACKDIEAGRVDFAIAGGVNMLLGSTFTDIMKDSGFLSRDGRCKTFDDSANGYVRAEGGGLVLLANEELVDNYYAEVLGSSVNQNGGRTQVITAPHPEAQEELIVDACRDAGVQPQQISYLECHGTGTKIGDPIEISAIQNTVARERQSICYLGSVKSNIGHLESAAGIAGLIKAVLALNKGLIPGNLHFNTPNRFIDFDSYHLRVVDRDTPLDQEALVGVSSFGFGGANAHVVLKGAQQEVRKPLEEHPSPFDYSRAAPITSYFYIDGPEVNPAASATAARAGIDVRALVDKVFFDLTGIREIDPELDLTDQGLDSLSATEFVSTLEKELGIEIDTDILFENPFVDQLVGALQQGVPGAGEQQQDDGAMDREKVARLVSAIFYELTNVKEIDADLALTDQGLDSLSGTELLSTIEKELKIEIDTDILFDHPLYDQLVDQIHARVSG